MLADTSLDVANVSYSQSMEIDLIKKKVVANDSRTCSYIHHTVWQYIIIPPPSLHVHKKKSILYSGSSPFDLYAILMSSEWAEQ